ncbi:MAG: histidine kinase dimerization/phosphoacceptor domain -containing protein [Cyclobacteriaceae bacterium]
MYKQILNIFFILLSISFSYANPDSLNQALSQAADPIQRVDILNELSSFQLDYSFKKSVNYGLEALELSKEIHYLRGEGIANLNLGHTYWINAFYSVALTHLTASTKIFTELDDTAKLAESNRLTGLLFFFLVEKDSAAKYLNMARTLYTYVQDSVTLALVLTELSFLYEIVGNTEESNIMAVEAHAIKVTGESLRAQYDTWMGSGHKGQAYQNKLIIHSQMPRSRERYENGRRNKNLYEVAKASSEIGSLFEILEDYDSAVWYYQISLGIYDFLKEERGKSNELVHIAECHMFQGNLSKAKPLFEETYVISLKEENHPRAGVALDYLGKIALSENRFDKALLYFGNALILSDTLGHLIDVVRFNRRLSDTYRSMGKYDRAIETANRSYLIAKEMGSLSHSTWGAEKVFLAHKESKNFEKALEYLTIYNDLSIQREKNVLSRENLQFQSMFELNEKAGEIDLLNQQNDVRQSKIDLQRSYLVSAILGVLIVLVFAIVFYNRARIIRNLNRKVSNQNTSLQSMNREKEVLLKEIHHRVKNNLQMISSLLGMQKRRVEESSTKLLFSYTQNRLKSMGLIHEHLYKSDTLSTIFLKPYIEDLVGSVLDSFCDQSKPTTTLNIPEYEVDIDTAISLGLMVNELVTNAVKYAFVDNNQPELEISIREDEKILKLTVGDNGPGGTIAQTGFGWTIINSMVENLSGSVELKNRNGLTVSILLKDYKLSA